MTRQKRKEAGAHSSRHNSGKGPINHGPTRQSLHNIRYRKLASSPNEQVNAKRLAPIHPGTILREDLEDAGVSINQLGRDLRVPVNRISAIVNGHRGITADTALRLARFFGNSAQYWMNLQALYDLEAVEPAKLEEIQRDVRRLTEAMGKKKPGPRYHWSRA